MLPEKNELIITPEHLLKNQLTGYLACTKCSIYQSFTAQLNLSSVQ